MTAGSAGAPALAPPAIAGATPTAPAGRGGRRPAGATVNPRSVVDFEDIAGVPFVFARHPMFHDAHVHVNAFCSDAFVDMDDLFAVAVPPSRTALVADPVAIIKTKIRDDFVVRNAVDTPDPAPVTPPWARCSFSISAGHRCPNRRLALATLREAMQHAIACNLVHELKIAIGMQALHFRLDQTAHSGELTLPIRLLASAHHQQFLLDLLHLLLLRHLVQHPQHPLTLRLQSRAQ